MLPPGRSRMPGRHAFVFVGLLAALAPGCGPRRDFAREAESLARAPDSLEALALFRDWHAARPDDADAYLSEANYWFTRSQYARMVPTPHPPEDPEDKPIRDSTGKIVGSLTESTGFDTLLTRHAAALLDPAIERFPHRLDLYFAQAHIAEAIDDFAIERNAIARAIAAATAHPEAMRWTHGDTLSIPVDRFVPAAVHAYAAHYAEEGTQLGNQRFADLAWLGAAAYPRDARLASDAAAAHRLAGQKPPPRREERE